MTELRPCPFCGGEPHRFSSGRVYCENPLCDCSDDMDQEPWNSRPIEDELRARINVLELDNKGIEDVLLKQRNRIKYLEEKIDYILEGN